MDVPGVLVFSWQVVSFDFAAQVGGEVSLALDLACRHRVSAPDAGGVAVRWQPDRLPTGGSPHTVTGRVVPFVHDCFLGGWVLDAGGVPVYVTDVDETSEPSAVARLFDREQGSDPVLPLPAAGARIRAGGRVGVAPDFVVEEVEGALLRAVRRSWTVRRIVLVPMSARAGRPFRPVDVASVDRRHDASGYLLDLSLVG